MEEPLKTPPAEENKESAAILENIQKLGENLNDVTSKLDEFEQKINEVAKPPVEEKEEEEPKWKPKSWDEFPEKAKEVAKQTFEEIESQRKDAEEETRKQAEEQQAKIDEEFNTQLTNLEKSGKIPAVKNLEDPNDPGRQARKELFGLGIKYNSPDLEAMADLRENFHQAGFTYDVENQKLVKSNPAPFGANAPVGSSSRTTGSDNKPSYKDIHNLSMDEMVRRFSS